MKRKKLCIKKKRIFLILAAVIFAAAAVLVISTRKEPKKVISDRAKFVFMEEAAQDIATQQGKSEHEICMEFGKENADGY